MECDSAKKVINNTNSHKQMWVLKKQKSLSTCFKKKTATFPVLTLEFIILTQTNVHVETHALISNLFLHESTHLDFQSRFSSVWLSPQITG